MCHEYTQYCSNQEDEPTSPFGDDSQGEAYPTISGIEAEQDRANIIKTSTLPHDSPPRVTSLAANEGSMQQLHELTDLGTRLQRQQTEMASKITAQDLKIANLKARIKLLEDKDGGGDKPSGEDATIKGRSLETGEEAGIERSTDKGSNDIEEMVNVLTSLDAASILTSGVQVATVSILPAGEIPTVSVPTGSGVVPTASPIFTTATVATPYLIEESFHCQKKSEATARKIALLSKFKKKLVVITLEDPLINSFQQVVSKLEMDQQYPTVAKIPVLDTGKFEQWQFWIQQYLQHEHYALWEVIEFKDSYAVPASSSSTTTTDTTSGETEDMQKKKNDVKARTTLLISLPNEHQLSDLDTISLDDLYNHLKVYESEVQKKSEPNSQNMAFISSAKHNSGNKDDTACAYIASQSSGSQIKFEDINQIDEDDIEERDIKWNMALLSMRADKFWKKTGKKISIQGSDVAGFDKSKVECFNCHKMGHFARECRTPKNQDRGRRDYYRQGSKAEEQAPKALMAIDGVGWDWSYMANDEEDHELVADEVAPTEFALMANTSAESKRKNDVKARTTLLLSLPDEHQLRFNNYKTAQELRTAILKTFGGNKATKKMKKNLLKQQYGNFKAEGTKNLEQTFNRLQVIVGQLQFIDVKIEHDDLNQKFLTSLALQWLMHTIVWIYRSDLDTMSLEDLYNHLKVYESEVQKKSKPNSENMAFISSAKHSRGNEEVNTANVFTASTNVPTASANVEWPIDKDDIEEMDIKWNMALLSMRADRFWKKTGKKISIQGTDVAGFDKSKVECFNCHKMGHFVREYMDPKSQDRGRRDNYRQGSKVEEQAPKALMTIDGVGWDWSYMANDEKNHALIADEETPTEFALIAKTSAESDVFDNSLCSKAYKKKSDSLNRLSECADDTVTNYSRPAPTIESSPDDAQNKNPSVTETEASPSTISPKPFIKFVKANDSPTKSKTDKVETAKKPHVKKRVKKGISRSQNNTHKSFTPRPPIHKPYRPPTKEMRSNMNAAWPNRTSFNKPAHSYTKRPFQRTSAGSSQNNINDKGYWDSGCSRHMTGNISYLSDYEPFDGGYVSFGQRGCKITGKGTMKTSKLEFEMYTL
nr:hypothetical protein [Tanacetum cinerariifolium]